MRVLTVLAFVMAASALLCAPALAQPKDKTPNAAESSAPKKGGKKKAGTNKSDAKDGAKSGDPAAEKQADDAKGDAQGKSEHSGKDNVGPQPAKSKDEPVGPKRPSGNNSAEAPKPGQGKPGSKAPVGPKPQFTPTLPAPPDLPSIAQDQPGFIPDKTPEDLFRKPTTQTPRQRYSSLLGESKLPPGDVNTIIGEQAQNPGGGLMDNQMRFMVPDGSISGSTEKKQFHITGGIIIWYNGVEITAEDADIDEKQETAVLKQNVEIVDPNYDLKTNELRIFFGEKHFEALGFVQFTKNAKPNSDHPNLSLPKKDRLRESFSAQQFELYCNKLYYNWGTKELTALQGVRLEHPSFSGTMDRLQYNDKDKDYLMEGTVGLNVTEYDWIFKNQLVDAKDEPKVRAVTNQPTKITADKVTYSDQSAIAQFYALNGNTVVFDQTERKVTSNYMEINDKTKDFYAEGSEALPAVFDQTSGNWLLESGMISKQDASEDLKKTLAKPMQAKAKTITFNYDRKRLEMRDAVEVTSDTQQLKAGEMIQDETAKFFLVRDNVYIKTDDKTEMRAAQVYVDTANDVYTFVGMVTGKGSGAAAGLPGANGAAGQQAGAQFGTGGGSAFGPQPADGQGGTGGSGVAPGVFQEQR
jgi:lipopolysaccharide export system protein LptA